MTIGERIKKLRMERKMSTYALAQITGLSQSSISKLENGKRKADNVILEQLAKAFNVSTDKLTGDSVSSIIESRLEETGKSLEQIAATANVPLIWLQNIDSFIPGNMEFMLTEPRELDWNDTIGEYTSYEWITRVADVLGLPGSVLRTALARQEIPVPDNLLRVTAEEAFGGINTYKPQDTDEFEPLSIPEKDHISKYRDLDPHGKEMVDFTLLKEWERSTAEHTHENNDSSQTTVHNPNVRLINYYYRLASAGTGQIVFDTPPTKRIEIPDIPEYRKADYAIGVNGSSMEPAFHDGDMLLIEMTDDITPGEVGIFLVDNESYVKKLGDGELISLNPEYNNVPLTENSKCMGRVIGKL